MGLCLHVAAHDSEGTRKGSAAEEHAGDDRVVDASTRFDAPVDREAGGPVLKHHAGARGHDPRSEAAEQALDERHGHPVAVDRAEVDRASERLCDGGGGLAAVARGEPDRAARARPRRRARARARPPPPGAHRRSGWPDRASSRRAGRAPRLRPIPAWAAELITSWSRYAMRSTSTHDDRYDVRSSSSSQHACADRAGRRSLVESCPSVPAIRRSVPARSGSRTRSPALGGGANSGGTSAAAQEVLV